MGAAVPPQGLPPPAQMGIVPHYDESTLIPSLPYFDLPAGLMVPLVKMEDSGYKPLDPKKIRLPPPTPPTERLLQALEAFYAPPSHDRPRDAEGWEMIGLYEWSKAKAAAVKKKADDIEAGDRERSPTASPDPYAGKEMGHFSKVNPGYFRTETGTYTCSMFPSISKICQKSV